MQRNKTWKLATGLMVLILLATPLMVMLAPGVSAATGNKLSINVFDDNGPVEGAIASLTEVRKQATQVTDVSDSAGLLEFTPDPGYYRLRISATGHYDYIFSDIIRFDGLTNVNLGVVDMDIMPVANLAVQFNVTNGAAAAITGASVIVKETHLGVTQVVASGVTNASGLLNVTLHYKTSNYTVVISKAYFATEVMSFNVTESKVQNVTLVPSISYSGTVTVAGSPATGVKAYLVDEASPLSAPDKKVIAATVNSNYFRFDAYMGNFTLLVDASGALSKISSVTITENGMVSVPLAAQNLQTVENAFAFAADDWNAAEMTKSMSLDYDYTVPGLDYAYLPSARMQIDLALGDGDGVVSTAELAAFEAVMASYGPLDVTTVNMMTVSTKTFVSVDADPDYSTSGLTAAVGSTNGFQVEIVADYVATGITNALSSYEVKVTTAANTASMGYSYKLAFPSGTDRYEMVKNVTSSTSITVSGYTEATVMAASTTGYATLTVQKSVAPTAAAAIVTGVAAYKVMNGSTFLYYIVAQDVNATFTATGSSDPNGNPLSYTWVFGDGNSTTVTTVTAVHAYATAEKYTVNLTVTDKGGLVAYKSFDVKVDGVAPVVVATENVTALGTTLTVDQNKAIKFNSASCYDRLNGSDEAGIIASYKWVFGDGNSTTVLMGENQTVTHTWAQPGTYAMYLNVTDVANHTASKMVTVTVKDTVAPTVKFSVKLNGTVVTSAKENQTLVFDASASSDVSGIASYLWDFGDGSTSNLTSPSHAFAGIKTFAVKLTLTDNAGNSANYTYNLKIESSARPDIRVGAVTFDPTKFTEGEDGYIYVNVTNVGTARAEGIFAQLYRINLDGSKTLLTDVSVLLVDDVEATYLEVGESGVIRMEHNFGSKGDYTLQVNVTANNEVTAKKTDNTATVSLEVQEAGWKSLLLYGGIFAVVIVVIVLFLFRKKLPMMPGKKKETAPSKKK
ncbi:MAG: PKD domain-containing protein [Methanomassiliicoccales archaeon]|nr:PKD domain-containing protein [Methanomassiliicoccales archaeon]